MTEPANFTKEELTIPAAKAQLHAMLYFIPFAILFGIPYFYYGIPLLQ